jgi:hypothetical protein
VLARSNKQIDADMEKLGEFLRLLFRHGPFSGKDFGDPALGPDYGPKVLWGEPALFQKKRNHLVRLGFRYRVRLPSPRNRESVL